MHTATLLQSGEVLIAGGIGPGSIGALASAEIYCPATGAFTPTEPLNVARINHATTLLRDGRVVVVGGAGGVVLDEAELY